MDYGLLESNGYHGRKKQLWWDTIIKGGGKMLSRTACSNELQIFKVSLWSLETKKRCWTIFVSINLCFSACHLIDNYKIDLKLLYVGLNYLHRPSPWVLYRYFQLLIKPVFRT